MGPSPTRPNLDYNGPDAFTYQVSDGNGGTATATVNLTVNAVNDDPVAVDDAYATDEDTPLVVAAPGVLANDTDVDGDALIAVGPHRADQRRGDAQPRRLLHLHAQRRLQRHRTASPTRSTTAAAEPPPPRSTSPSTRSTTPPSRLTTCMPPTRTPRWSSPHPASWPTTPTSTATPSRPSLVTGPANGAVTLNPDGSFTYTPNADYNGPDSFTYQVDDGNGGTATATVNLTVNASTTPRRGRRRATPPTRTLRW